jgi:hypothetical protein
VQWAELGQKKVGRTGRYGGLHDEKSRKRKRLMGGLPRIPGQTNFWAALRNRKCFSDFDSRNEIQI